MSIAHFIAFYKQNFQSQMAYDATFSFCNTFLLRCFKTMCTMKCIMYFLHTPSRYFWCFQDIQSDSSRSKVNCSVSACCVCLTHIWWRGAAFHQWWEQVDDLSLTSPVIEYADARFFFPLFHSISHFHHFCNWFSLTQTQRAISCLHHCYYFLPFTCALPWKLHQLKAYRSVDCALCDIKPSHI